jgi:hypothetical protein
MTGGNMGLYADSLAELRCRLERLREAAERLALEIEAVSEGM